MKLFENFPQTWRHVLDNLDESTLLDLSKNIEDAYSKGVCFPPAECIFKAFDLVSPDKVKVVIIGQDPYHGFGQAHGLSFSVKSGKLPPSLKNIYKELELENLLGENRSGDLSAWARQGVLLLNKVLTVQEAKPNSHLKLGWHYFTTAIIEHLNDRYDNLVFLLWGNNAQELSKKINANKHLVLTSGHPSPMSANQGKWFGNNHFTLTNAYLKKHHSIEIDWSLND